MTEPTPEKDFAAARGDTSVLLPYQKRWIADESTVKVIEKSRRVGISWAEAADAALYASRQNGGDVLYIGYNRDMAREFISDCANWSRAYNLAASEVDESVFEEEGADGEKTSITVFRVSYASGHFVKSLSSRPRDLRGKQARVIVDEASHHDDLPGIMKAAMAHTMWGGTIRIISTHNGETNPFNELITDTRAGKNSYALHRVTLDEALADGLYRRICKVLKREWSPEAETAWREALIRDYGDGAQEELFCIPSQGSGVFLSRLLIESCMDPAIPVLRWECPEGFAQLPDAVRAAQARAWCDDHLAARLAAINPNANTYLGGDFGRSGDLSAFLPLVESLGLSYRAPCLVELRNVPFREQELILFFILDRLPRFRGAALDARGNGQYLAEVAMQRYGESRIQQVMITIDWYREAMPKYKAMFEDRTIALPQDADVLDDHRAVKMIKGVAKLPDSGPEQKGRDGKQRHGDSAIAGAMAAYAVKTSTSGPVEYASAGKRGMYRSDVSDSSDRSDRDAVVGAPRFGKGCW